MVKNLKNVCPTLLRHPRTFFFILTILAGLAYLWPLRDFQYYLSQGDHGRDLYAFKKTMQGAVPYRDYSWVLGLLMPYYYALFYRVFGLTIQSVLIGQNLLVLSAGILIYLIGAVFLSPVIAFIAAFSYWSVRGSEFFYTYVHNGGLVTLLATVLCLLLYIKKKRMLFVYLGYFALFLLILTRLNMGLANCAAFSLLLAAIDFSTRDPRRKTKLLIYAAFSAGLLSLTALIYGAILKQLPDYAIAQYFPFVKGQRTDSAPSITASLAIISQQLKDNLFGSWVRRAYMALFSLSLISLIMTFLKKTTSGAEHKKPFLLALTGLLVFILFTFHEYLLSGVFYRVFWFLPLCLLLFYYVLGRGLWPRLSPPIQTILCLTLTLIPFLNLTAQLRLIDDQKTPAALLRVGNNRVYSFQDPLWLSTVTETVAYIQARTTPDEKIFAFPFDHLYYFLSGRDSASPQLFFYQQNITEQQERDVIADLEKNRVRYILLSNRVNMAGPWLGSFGDAYCPLLFKYFTEHFETVAAAGDWQNPSGWAWNHGVKILKRK